MRIPPIKVVRASLVMMCTTVYWTASLCIHIMQASIYATYRWSSQLVVSTSIGIIACSI